MTRDEAVDKAFRALQSTYGTFDVAYGPQATEGIVLASRLVIALEALGLLKLYPPGTVLGTHACSCGCTREVVIGNPVGPRS
jgi:hypothetical protein